MDKYEGFDSIPCTGVKRLSVARMGNLVIIMDDELLDVMLVRSPGAYIGRRRLLRPWMFDLRGDRGAFTTPDDPECVIVGRSLSARGVNGSILMTDDIGFARTQPYATYTHIVIPGSAEITLQDISF